MGGCKEGEEPERDPAFPRRPHQAWGLRRILRWESSFVLGPATLEAKPLNARASLTVHLRDLQRETGLSDPALERIRDVAGPHYDPAAGTITIVREGGVEREHNRRECIRALYALIEDGHRAHPNPAGRTTTNPAAWAHVVERAATERQAASLASALHTLSDEELERLERQVEGGKASAGSSAELRKAQLAARLLDGRDLSRAAVQALEEFMASSSAPVRATAAARLSHGLPLSYSFRRSPRATSPP